MTLFYARSAEHMLSPTDVWYVESNVASTRATKEYVPVLQLVCNWYKFYVSATAQGIFKNYMFINYGSLSFDY